MKNIVTSMQKVFGLCLMLTISMAGIVHSQTIVPPEDTNDLQDFPLIFNMDTDAVDWSDYTFHDFEGAALARIDNPDASGLNETDYVLEYIKAGGEPWAGFFYHTDEEMFLTEDSEFRLKIWSHRDDIEALLKLEMRDAPDVTTGDLFADVTASGEWIELTWNFSELLDISAHDGAPYDRVVIILDLGGGAGDGSDAFIWYLDDFTFDDGDATSTELIDSEIPFAVTLHQNYPNPFNPATTIEFGLPQSAHTTLEVFNMLGQNVATLVNETLSAGTHTANFDASNLSSGVYIYRLQSGNSVQTKKLTLIK